MTGGSYRGYKSNSIAAVTNIKVSLTATTQKVVLGVNEYRSRVVFTNNGATEVFVAKGKDAADEVGLRVAPSGGVVIDECDSRGKIWTREWTAYCASSQDLSICEEGG